eukprot:jgi/Hompol1/1427/HPOL_001388-RA
MPYPAGQNVPVSPQPQLQRPRPNIDAILNASYIIGSHTVNVRPPTIAKLNPNSSIFCIPASIDAAAIAAVGTTTASVISVPLLIKGIPPFKIDYEIYSPANASTSQVTDVQITSNDAVTASLRDDGTLLALIKDPSAAKLSKRRVGLYALQVSQPGIYRLTAVREANGEPGKIGSSKIVEIAECPSAQWQSIQEQPPQGEDPEGIPTFDRCVDSSIKTSIVLSGVPPLTAIYVKQVGRAESLITVESNPVKETSAAPSATAGEQHDDEFLQAVARNLAIKTALPVSFQIDQDSPHVFRIARVIDGLNNTVNYQTLSSIRLPSSFLQSSVFNIPRQGDAFIVNGHPHPTLRFADCDGIKIRAGGSTALGLRMTGSSPFTVALQRTLADGTKLHFDVKDIADANSDLQINEPGSYSLISVQDRFC